MNFIAGAGVVILLLAGLLFYFSPDGAFDPHVPEVTTLPAGSPEAALVDKAVATQKAAATPSGNWSGPTAPLFAHVSWMNLNRPQPGKPLLLEFWATWCPPCRQSIPHLNAIYAENKARGLQVVGLTKEDLGSVVIPFTKGMPMNYSVGQDSSGSLSRKFEVSGIPAAFLFNKDGKMVWSGHPMMLRGNMIDRAFEE